MLSFADFKFRRLQVSPTSRFDDLNLCSTESNRLRVARRARARLVATLGLDSLFRTYAGRMYQRFRL